MKSNSKKMAPNIYLVGFMGVGKSAIGKRLARHLGFQFIDSDHAIEKMQGKSIPEIFATEGETAFRKLEAAFIDSGHPEHNAVISCGGGLVCQPGMEQKLRDKGVVFCLFASLESILERTSRNNNRPLLAGDDRAEKIRTLLAEREPIYRRVGVSISTEGRSIPEVVKSIARAYRSKYNS